MLSRHMPRVDTRYWVAILCASLFGTNAGDLYAHTTGLGIVPGVLILAALAALAFLAERRDPRVHEVWYWVVIIIIRTGATNIADFLAFRARIPAAPLTFGLALLIAGFAWMETRLRGRALDQDGRLPATGPNYWAAMLAAGVFGTVLGDVCSHAFGQGRAALALGAVLLAVIGVWRAQAGRVWCYWLAVAAARSAGTAMGDFLAENRTLQIGLPLSTLITGSVFVAVLLAWPRATRRPDTA